MMGFMRIALLRLTSIAALTLTLVGAGPATRPTAGRLTVRVERSDARATLSSIEVFVEPGGSFSAHTRFDNVNLNLDGSLELVGQSRRVTVRYEEFAVDPRTGGLNKHRISTRVELEPGQDEWALGGWNDQRLTLRLLPAAQP